DDAVALRALLAPGVRLVVVGGGFIGAEVAATARSLGAEVTIVEMEPTLLARSVGVAIGSTLAEVHDEAGVALRCGVPVAGVEGDGRVERVRLADGRAIEADVVVVGLGVRPSTDWLLGSGLELADGIVCDASCRASAPGVVAAGDVARWAHPRLGPVRIEHWENAVMQGRAAATTLLAAGPPAAYAPVPYVWSDQYEHKIQVVGRPGPDAELLVVDGSLAERRFVALYVERDVVTGAIALGRPRSVLKIRRLLHDDVTVAQVLDVLADGGRPAAPAAELGRALSRMEPTARSQ
ncbi:MAG TPA: FAD-dependent oxidoreductase, partial [Baekduia sp.]|nr:FAD-dependent oxidoreductase [Baekduia sp.]